MSIWNYIGEFILFRWLFGNRNRSHNVGGSNPINTINYTQRRVDIEDSIANDLEDDLRNIRNSDYGRYHGHNDYSDYDGYQSHDNFLDEQDDHDMMEDDF